MLYKKRLGTEFQTVRRANILARLHQRRHPILVFAFGPVTIRIG
jgi:hypothetical protein